MKKINSIFDINEGLFFKEKDQKNHEYITSGNYYEWYYSISKEIQPKSILEIGVRYGYSLCSMALACDKDIYLEGWDSVIDLPECEHDILLIAEKNLRGLGYNNINLKNVNSHATSINRVFDLVHIDGDHSYEGKVADLNLVKNKTTFLIVDDYFHVNAVKRAVDLFVEQNLDIIESAELFDSFRGTAFIKFKNNLR